MVICAPKSSLLLDAVLSVDESRHDFDDELAAAFKDEFTLADTRVFPPSKSGMPECNRVRAVVARGV